MIAGRCTAALRATSATSPQSPGEPVPGFASTMLRCTALEAFQYLYLASLEGLNIPRASTRKRPFSPPWCHDRPLCALDPSAATRTPAAQQAPLLRSQPAATQGRQSRSIAAVLITFEQPALKPLPILSAAQHCSLCRQSLSCPLLHCSRSRLVRALLRPLLYVMGVSTVICAYTAALQVGAACL